MKCEIWAEFMPYDWVRGDLRRLHQHGLQLNLAIPSGRLHEPGLKRLLAEAQALDVPVGAWLLLPDALGYWPNAENAEAFQHAVRHFLDWLSQHDLQVAEIIVDMETPLALSRLLKGRLLQGLRLEYRRWLHPLQQERFAQASAIFAEIVAEVHQAGLAIQVVTYPFVVHDALAGNQALQSLLQIPVTSVPWDRISLMIYRSSFQDLFPLPLSAWLVGEYLQQARRVFSQPVQAALGVIGTVGKLTEGGFRDPAALRADVAAARMAGAQGLQFFSLDGMHQLGAPEHWLQLYQTPARACPPTPGDRLLWQLLQQSHRLLSQPAQVLGSPV